jgi:hypothetical protein
MRNGQVFELQMPTPHTKDSESSSLPTPKARDHQAEGYEAGLRRASPQVGTIVKALVEGDERILLRSPKASEGQGGALGEAEARKRGNTVGVRDQIMDLVAAQGMRVSRSQINDLLPTPNTMEHREIKTPEQIAELKAKSPGGYRNLRETVVNEMPMLPTPTTQDGKNNGGPSQFNRNTKPLNTQVLVKTEWGKFEPAVRVWEQEIEREAPSPTKPDGKEGAHRLSSKFTEWMMGLPEGWITDVGLTRNEELKLAGNGVVPQQAELALKILLENTPPPLGPNLTKLPTPTVSDTYTDNLKSTQQKEGSMHSVTLAQISQRI